MDIGGILEDHLTEKKVSIFGVAAADGCLPAETRRFA